MTLDSILLLATAVFALAIKPGAGMMMVMSRTMAQGMSACLTFALGFCIVSLLFLGLVIFGYKFIETVDIVLISIVIKSFSAVYLIWLGVKGLQQASEPLYVEGTKKNSFYENLQLQLF